MNGNTADAPRLSRPRIHYCADIYADPTLEQRVRNFANEGYLFIAPKDASRWDPDDSPRLPTSESIRNELGDRGFFAVLYDPNDDTKPIACAASTPWKCDLEGGGRGDKGWEIKIVTSGAGWMRGGNAGRCVKAIIDELVEQEQKKDSTTERKIKVWVQTVACVNGAYWTKKGWKEVRSYDKPKGHWGSKLGYQLLVLLQEFEVTNYSYGSRQ
jgi:hypothetical protein